MSPFSRKKVYGDEISFNTKSYNSADFIYYGSDASQCKPMVEAEIDKGVAARGKEANVSYYMAELATKRSKDYPYSDT
jgi:hypothetical protein